MLNVTPSLILKATDLLLDIVQTGAQSERWIACQCLAEHHHHDDCIIIEMLNMVQNGVDPVKRKRIEYFLRELSNLTVRNVFLYNFPIFEKKVFVLSCCFSVAILRLFFLWHRIMLF